MRPLQDVSLLKLPEKNGDQKMHNNKVSDCDYDCGGLISCD